MAGFARVTQTEIQEEIAATSLRKAARLPPPSPRVYLAESVCPRNIDTAENYTSVQRSQHITQADLRVFGQSYLANCSSVDGQAAFLGELSDHRHIEYFQSIERFWEPGLPHELPARVETS